MGVCALGTDLLLTSHALPIEDLLQIRWTDDLEALQKTIVYQQLNQSEFIHKTYMYMRVLRLECGLLK